MANCARLVKGLNVHMSRPMGLEAVERRQEHTPFQVLEHGSELDAAQGGFATARSDEILGRHGPSWAKRPRENARVKASSMPSSIHLQAPFDFHVVRIHLRQVLVHRSHDEPTRRCARKSESARKNHCPSELHCDASQGAAW
jgi:hypothetical protein